MKPRPTPLELFAVFWIVAFAAGNLAAGYGAVVGWLTILWVAFLVGAIAGAVGYFWEEDDNA